MAGASFIANEALDPDGVETFDVDWSTWLAGETITSHQVTVTNATLDSDAEAAGVTSATVSAAQDGTVVSINFHVVSDSGRADDATIIVRAREK